MNNSIPVVASINSVAVKKVVELNVPVKMNPDKQFNHLSISASLSKTQIDVQYGYLDVAGIDREGFLITERPMHRANQFVRATKPQDPFVVHLKLHDVNVTLLVNRKFPEIQNIAIGDHRYREAHIVTPCVTEPTVPEVSEIPTPVILNPHQVHPFVEPRPQPNVQLINARRNPNSRHIVSGTFVVSNLIVPKVNSGTTTTTTTTTTSSSTESQDTVPAVPTVPTVPPTTTNVPKRKPVSTFEAEEPLPELIPIKTEPKEKKEDEIEFISCIKKRPLTKKDPKDENDPKRRNVN